MAAASTRLVTPSLPRMFETWTPAVLSLMNNALPIWRFDSPPTSWSSTSSSRSVSPNGRAGGSAAPTSVSGRRVAPGQVDPGDPGQCLDVGAQRLGPEADGNLICLDERGDGIGPRRARPGWPAIAEQVGGDPVRLADQAPVVSGRLPRRRLRLAVDARGLGLADQAEPEAGSRDRAASLGRLAISSRSVTSHAAACSWASVSSAVRRWARASLARSAAARRPIVRSSAGAAVLGLDMGRGLRHVAADLLVPAFQRAISARPRTSGR